MNIGFHEILIQDLEEEEFVAMGELGCLRLDWPKTLLRFMSRYPFDLDQMRKDYRERFGSTQSALVHTVVNIYSRIWVNILFCITWNSHSCGAVQSHGVRFGRARLMIVSTT